MFFWELCDELIFEVRFRYFKEKKYFLSFKEFRCSLYSGRIFLLRFVYFIDFFFRLGLISYWGLLFKIFKYVKIEFISMVITLF